MRSNPIPKEPEFIPPVSQNERHDLLEGNLTQQEILSQVQELWQDRSVHSFTVRRHSDYERDPGMRGALSKEGISLAREHAKTWAESLPEDSDVALYQSPSFQFAKTIKDSQSGESRDVLPMRATITASIYEKEIHGNQRPGRRITDQRLGDFFEQANSSENVQKFFKVLGQHYGKLTQEFWKDFAHRTIHPEVNKAMLEAGGHDSLQLAKNLSDWLADSSDVDNDAEAKKVGLAVTHGETIYAFLHHLSRFLEQEGLTDADTVSALRDFDPTYNEGMDVHVSHDKTTVVVANKHAAAFPLEDYRKFLAGENKNAESGA